MRRGLFGLFGLCACVLPPSPLGVLPGTGSTTDAASSTGDASTTPTTAGPGATVDSTGEPASTGGTTGGFPDSAWGQYCEYIASHGGDCDPDVDMAPDLVYPGSGFVVHEWGTDTVVVGSDGVSLRGLQHEEEALPGFVHDRLAAGMLADSVSVYVKMETPVVYFYSPVARTVAVKVDFPAGEFTQWYPPVAAFSPWVAAPGAVPKLGYYADPSLDPWFPFASQVCIDQYAQIGAGRLDWGNVDVLARGEQQPLLDAPLDDYTWGLARVVDSNLLRVVGVPGAEQAQHERFLFYRGLGNFPLPLTIGAGEGGALQIDNASASAVGRVFVLNVDGERGAFLEWPGGVAAQEMLAAQAPSLAPAPPLDLFAAALAERVTEALDAAGLYHDEAVAMVATWNRQWFRTPGLRVLYLVPQAWTETSIPLTVAPAPDVSVRVMLIRSEVVTPELEAVDVAAAGKIAGVETADAGMQHFLALGRFAEPRLRRAAQLLGEPDYLAGFLTQLTHADTRVVAGE